MTGWNIKARRQPELRADYETGLFQKHAGIPTVVCGPGSIEQAHKPDEFVTLDQIAPCEAFMRRLIDLLAEGGVCELGGLRVGGRRVSRLRKAC